MKLRGLLGLNTTKRVYFVYSEKYRDSGSTVMRGKQLSTIVNHFLPSEYAIEYAPSSYDFKNSVLFLTKGALKTGEEAWFHALKKNHNILLYDPVDEFVPDHALHFVDVIVAASLTAFDAYLHAHPSLQVTLVNHHVDPRVRAIHSKINPTYFRAGYFGELLNTYLTPGIEKLVEFIGIDTSRADSDWLDHIDKYSLHYAIRKNRSLDNHKPFLKGFTAAACRCNVLIQESQTEALRWLGKDYPYLLKGKVREDSVIEMLNYCRESFGSKEWNHGLSIMRDIEDKTSDLAISNQFLGLLKSLR